jgi:hypothetical protein
VSRCTSHPPAAQQAIKLGQCFAPASQPSRHTPRRQPCQLTFPPRCRPHVPADLINIFEVFLPQLLLYPNPTDPLNSEAAALLMREPALFATKVKGESLLQYATPICCEV